MKTILIVPILIYCLIPKPSNAQSEENGLYFNVETVVPMFSNTLHLQESNVKRPVFSIGYGIGAHLKYNRTSLEYKNQKLVYRYNNTKSFTQSELADTGIHKLKLRTNIIYHSLGFKFQYSTKFKHQIGVALGYYYPKHNAFQDEPGFIKSTEHTYDYGRLVSKRDLFRTETDLEPDNPSYIHLRLSHEWVKSLIPGKLNIKAGIYSEVIFRKKLKQRGGDETSFFCNTSGTIYNQNQLFGMYIGLSHRIGNKYKKGKEAAL